VPDADAGRPRPAAETVRRLILWDSREDVPAGPHADTDVLLWEAFAPTGDPRVASLSEIVEHDAATLRPRLLALLAAIGLFAASKLQFSVAAFVSMGILIVGLSSGTLKQVVEQKGIVGIDHDTGQVSAETFINRTAVTLYGGAQKLIDLITGYDPVDALSTGRMITWGRLAQAVLLVVGVAGGAFASLGIWIFTRRELAAPI